MNIRDYIGQLNENLEKLGLQQIVAESSRVDDSFRVVYVNKNVQKRHVAGITEKKRKKRLPHKL